MNKYSEYKEAYKKIIIENLIKQAKFNKAINIPKQTWKGIHGYSRFVNNNIGDEILYDAQALKDSLVKLLYSKEALQLGKPENMAKLLSTANKASSEPKSGRILDLMYDKNKQKIQEILGV